MAIYEMTASSIRKIEQTSFETAGLRERDDLQRLLRDQIDIISPDTLIIAEEFGEWEDCKRRIDLLGLDKDANLIVCELKRTDDGGHMELQAIRYAAMISAMTFEKAVEVYSNYLRQQGKDTDAQAAILEFLGWEEPNEEEFAQDVRVVLASAEFSKEITTAVMWLNERDLDIRCIRIKPYSDNGRILLDVQQVIPLPEATEYTVKLREKEGRERSARKEQSQLNQVFYRFWMDLLQRARRKTDIHANISPSPQTWISAGAGFGGVGLVYAFGKVRPRVELSFCTGNKELNKHLFDQIEASKNEIEKAYGGSIRWERLDDKQTSYVRADLPAATVRDEANWPALADQMIDAMIRFENALRPHLEKLRRG